ncbi:hypothetical protein T484DRAFT_1816768 [Baffinella frigidus]|nr:hypothetical protein T484DRAFT_1816768 [Cryptophyta sp. CCMP2293]
MCADLSRFYRCETDRKDVALESLQSDEHSPAKYRVLGVLSNFQPFAKAFNCPTGVPRS